MKKVKIYPSLDPQIADELQKRADQLNISKSELVSIAIESELGNFDVHAENRKLKESSRKAEKQICEIKTECDRLNREISAVTEERDGFQNDLTTECHQSGALKESLDDMTQQRDEFEKQLHNETDAYNKCFERAESRQKQLRKIAVRLSVPDTAEYIIERINAIEDNFKSKIDLLLKRGLWSRIFNVIPWK